eukprot:jgi/Psemu1/50291/gm1.50291_g
MTPDQQDNTTQEADKEDVSISDLFPSFDPALATFLHDSFDIPKESHCTLCEALITRQYRTWSDFLFIEDDIDALTYQEGDWEERDHYTKEAFRKYWHGIVKANRDSTANRVVVTTQTIPTDGPGRSIKPIDQLKYESWIRKQRAETTFPPVHSTSSTPAVHNSPPTTACKTHDHHPTDDNTKNFTSTPYYTWKYVPNTDSVRFTKVTSTPNNVHTDIPTGDVP